MERLASLDELRLILRQLMDSNDAQLGFCP